MHQSNAANPDQQNDSQRHKPDTLKRAGCQAVNSINHLSSALDSLPEKPFRVARYLLPGQEGE